MRWAYALLFLSGCSFAQQDADTIDATPSPADESSDTDTWDTSLADSDTAQKTDPTASVPETRIFDYALFDRACFSPGYELTLPVATWEAIDAQCAPGGLTYVAAPNQEPDFPLTQTACIELPYDCGTEPPLHKLPSAFDGTGVSRIDEDQRYCDAPERRSCDQEGYVAVWKLDEDEQCYRDHWLVAPMEPWAQLYSCNLPGAPWPFLLDGVCYRGRACDGVPYPMFFPKGMPGQDTVAWQQCQDGGFQTCADNKDYVPYDQLPSLP